MIGEDVYGYEAAQVAVYSVDIPVAAQKISACGEKDFVLDRNRSASHAGVIHN